MTDKATTGAGAGRTNAARRERALAELGETACSRAVAALVAATVLATLLLPGFAQLPRGWSQPAALRARSAGLGEVWRTDGALAASGELAAAFAELEASLEEESALRPRLRPLTQWLLARLGRAGNDKAVLGRDGWLYFRPDVRHLTGPGFLPARARSSAAESRTGEPVTTIVDLARQLAARGIHLVVLPVPAKPSIEPQGLAPALTGAEAALLNPSHELFVRRLVEAGVDVLEVAPLLVSVRLAQGSAYLKTDTHWRPEAMRAVARSLAARVVPRLPPATSPPALEVRPAEVSGPGDIVRLLGLGEDQTLFPPESVRIERIVGPGGEPWIPDPAAQILLLGDSFTNVYSLESLGFGTSAGLAEALALELGRPVDRIALNDAGARSSRQRLALELARGERSLEATRVVVFEFAARELSFGDWAPIALPRGASSRQR